MPPAFPRTNGQQTPIPQYSCSRTAVPTCAGRVAARLRFRHGESCFASQDRLIRVAEWFNRPGKVGPRKARFHAFHGQETSLSLMTTRRVCSLITASSVLLVGVNAQAEDVAADTNASFYEVLGEDDPNPATYEFSFLSIGLNQNFGLAHWHGGGIYFGAGGGLGPTLWRIAKVEDRDIQVDNTIEIVYGNTYLRVTPVEYVDLDFGGRIALGATNFDISDAPRSTFITGGYADLRFGSKTIKLGPRFEYDHMVYADFSEDSWRITPLMLRVMK